jgi:hypothetical protein
MSATKSRASWTLSRVLRLANLCVLAVVITISPGVGCAPTPEVTWGEAMPQQTPQLVGSWEKITRTACGETYPDSIQFQEVGLYFGQKNPPGTFTQWDVGTYEIADPKQIRISTANDAIVTYEFSISNDVLTFVDPDDCEFRYRRVA